MGHYKKAAKLSARPPNSGNFAVITVRSLCDLCVSAYQWIGVEMVEPLEIAFVFQVVGYFLYDSLYFAFELGKILRRKAIGWIVVSLFPEFHEL